MVVVVILWAQRAWAKRAKPFNDREVAMASAQRASMVGLIAEKVTSSSTVVAKFLQITLAIWQRERERERERSKND